MDLSNQVFGRLTALQRTPGKKEAYWDCECSCGNIKSVSQGHLRHGSIKSCGCLRKEKSKTRATKHGLRHSPEYNSYRAMLDRCTQTYYPGYENYGGRGIRVCERWADPDVGIFNFIEDMGPRPSPDHTLDRINNEGDYCLENCRWVERKVQLLNRRKVKNKTSQYKGVGLTQDGNLWRCRIYLEGKEKSLGVYEKEIDAAIAWDNEARKNGYEESWLNFPKEEINK